MWLGLCMEVGVAETVASPGKDIMLLIKWTALPTR